MTAMGDDWNCAGQAQCQRDGDFPHVGTSRWGWNHIAPPCAVKHIAVGKPIHFVHARSRKRSTRPNRRYASRILWRIEAKMLAPQARADKKRLSTIKQQLIQLAAAQLMEAGDLTVAHR